MSDHALVKLTHYRSVGSGSTHYRSVHGLKGRDLTMFDASYFREGLKKQVEQVGGNPVVKLALHSGEMHLVRDVVETRDGFVLLNVYPSGHPAGIVAASTSAYSNVPPSGYHPLAVAYEAISNVYLSTTSAAQRPRIGFNT